MTAPFSAYAAAYDALYRDKDYAAEVDVHLGTLALVGLPAPRTLLDVGCGTGGHALVHAARGVAVVGLDCAPAMLEIARAKASDLKSDPTSSLPTPGFVPPEFLLGDATKFDLSRTFEAVAAYFAVVSYLTAPEDFIGFLQSARKSLTLGGSLYFDCWHGAAVLHTPPSIRIRDFSVGGRRFIRMATPSLDRAKATTIVHYDVLTINNGRLVAELSEDHIIRGFFLNEMESLLRLTGFKPLALFPEGCPGKTPTEHDWIVAALAVAV